MPSEEILRIPSATRADLVLTAFKFGPATARKHVAIVAGLHGDEHNSVYVAASIVRRLSELPESAFQGRVTVIPAVNVFGLNTGTRFWPFDETDINRVFPGYDGGETTQRIAARVTAALSDITHLIDIHSSNESLREMPQVRLYEQGQEIVDEAKTFGLPLVWRRTPNATVSNQLAFLTHKHVPNTYILQGGSARRINKRFADQLTAGIGRFLETVGIVSGASLPNDAPPVESQVIDRGHVAFCHALDAGIFVTHAETGDTVSAGQLIGEIMSPLDGRVLASVTSPTSGLLMSLRVFPVVYENDLLARIAGDATNLTHDMGRSVREDYEMQ